MAASEDVIYEWRVALNSLKIFEEFRDNLLKYVKKEIKEPCSLLRIVNRSLYLWDNLSGLICLNLGSEEFFDGVSEYSSTVSDINGLQDVDFKDERSKGVGCKLCCTNTPKFQVESISLNQTERLFLLWGRGGACVLELPSFSDSAKQTVNCRTTQIAERFFQTSSSVKILQAAWHPGSDSDSHVSILTSDNVLRIFDVNNPLKPFQSHRLGDYGQSLSATATHSRLGVALGEIAVAFDFGEPFEAVPGDAGSILYPIYVLKGNGDVCVLNTSLTNRKYFYPKVKGPLLMLPPAEDNYGLEACSILYLPSTPPVVVVATSSGYLHHCIVMDNDETSPQEGYSRSSSHFGASSYHDRSEISEAESVSESLYVYESVELSMSLLTCGSEEDDVSFPIILHRDPRSNKCYYCCHSAGMHGIYLPWLEKMERFCTTEENPVKPELDATDDEVASDLEQDQACVVQHLICTRPSESCPPAPVIGFSIIPDVSLGNLVLCITSDGECLVKEPVSELSEPPPLLADQPSAEILSPLRQISTEPFQNQIKKILQRNVSYPIMKRSSKTELPLQDSLKLLQRATHILREEYVQKQDDARDEIEKRVRILEQQKALQLQDLEECSRMQEEFKERASSFAERYEDIAYTQDDLLQRVGTVLHFFQRQLPVLSEAEQEMRSDLHQIQDQLQEMENNLNEVKKKHDFHKRQHTAERPTSSPGLSKSTVDNTKSLLKEEQDEIAALMDRVKNLQMEVS